MRPTPEGTVAKNAKTDNTVSAMLDAGLTAADAAMSETKAQNVNDIGNVVL
nr:hypothetical protein [uncultured Prevotella sp.]